MEDSHCAVPLRTAVRWLSSLNRLKTAGCCYTLTYTHFRLFVYNSLFRAHHSLFSNFLFNKCSALILPPPPPPTIKRNLILKVYGNQPTSLLESGTTNQKYSKIKNRRSLFLLGLALCQRTQNNRNKLCLYWCSVKKEWRPEVIGLG